MYEWRQVAAYEWRVEPQGSMRVPAVLYADEPLMQELDERARQQLINVATLPGIVRAAYGMPDAHWGYGFPIGGVAAFDAAQGGVVSAGGVGFDISCGVRLLTSGLPFAEFQPQAAAVADELARAIPAGMGRTGPLRVTRRQLDEILTLGARWAVEQGFGTEADLQRIEEGGQVPQAQPQYVSEKARTRQLGEMGTLGSGNHYLEVQRVAAVFQPQVASRLGLMPDEVVVTIHCGSRGLGHQIGTEYLREMSVAAPRFGLVLPDRELACAPLESELGQRYLGAMRAAMNCALANRQILTGFVRQVFARFFPDHELKLLYDVSHNVCKEETHAVDGIPRRLFVHRKGATRAFGPGHPELPADLRDIGQPVLIGGSMGTCSYVLLGSERAAELSFSSACHGAGRRLSRTAASRQWRGRELIEQLAAQGILIRSPSMRGVAEEAPDAYKSVTAVVDVAERAGLARKVARLDPLVCIKG
ncbi:MAG: RtcB family protein [Steroidobacteraceae bacterium]|nr:RtcB family protein [Steroidobacteraceae bacterium]MDW8259390.1 RtcB family protein [Gammaproteobacteria bacterium]